eukprot:361835_1
MFSRHYKLNIRSTFHKTNIFKRVFVSDNKIGVESNISSKYMNRIHATCEDYVKECNEWTEWTEPMIDKYIRENYIENSKIDFNNYLEIGPGDGYAVQRYAPYFKNTILVEPNKIYMNKLNQILMKNNSTNNSNINYRFIHDVIEDCGKYFFKNESNNINLINVQHVMYHVNPQDYYNVFDKIIDNIAPNNKGVAIISMLTDDATKYPHYTCHLEEVKKLGIERLEWTTNIERYLNEIE